MSKNKKHKKIFWLIIVLSLLSRIFRRKKPRLREIERNFREFGLKENKEIARVLKKKEKFADFKHNFTVIAKDYFIPHKGNNHQPKILRHHTLIGLVLFAAILKIGVVTYLYFIFPYQAEMSELLTNQVLELTNHDRQLNGLPPLNLNEILTFSAQAKANDMAKKGYFSHTAPDGKKPWDFIDRNKYAYIFVGENLAMNFTSAQTVHSALMNSPGHRHNILNKRYSDVGLAVAKGVINGKPTDILVELFAVRATPKTAVAVKKPEVTTEKITESPTIPVKVLAATNSESSVLDSSIKNPTIQNKEVVKTSASKQVNRVELQKKLTNKTEKQTLTQNKSMPVINHPGDQVFLRKTPEKDHTLTKPIFAPLNTESLIVYPQDKNSVRAASVARISNFIFLMMFVLLFVALLLKIFVRIHIQHRPIIIQSILALTIIAFLIVAKFHFLEQGITAITLL